MSSWLEFTAAYIAFLVSHAIPVRPPVRSRLVALLGLRGFAFGYSALSLAVLVWLIVAAGRAPYVELWARALWQGWVTLAAMLAALAVLAVGLFRPNPLSFGGSGNARFDPDDPGPAAWIRHPVLAALALWAFGHLVPNGDLAHVLLFGGFGLFALLGGRLVDRRKAREMGQAEWEAIVARVRQGGWRPKAGDALRVALGLLLAWALLHLHGPVIGVDPRPW